MMAESNKKKRQSNAEKPISLKPLKFDEAVSDLLKVKPPEEKKTKPKASKADTRQQDATNVSMS